MQTANRDPDIRKAGRKVILDGMTDKQWNVSLENIAKLIELKTGDAEAAKIVRDSKIPVKEEKEKPVTQSNKTK